MDGHLVTIETREEDDFVVRLLQDQKYWISNNIGSFNQGPWTGAIQLDESREPDGGWRWITGEEFVYSNWHADREVPHSQPNDGLTPYAGQNRVFYHVRGNDYLKAAWGDATSNGSVRCFVVEFDGMKVIDDQPRLDMYASLVVNGGTGFKRTGLTIRGEGIRHGKDGLVRLDFDLKRTLFVPPGQYQWQLLDLSNDRGGGVFESGTITARAGQRVMFTPEDGPEMQSE
jgi:hypothetical protein